MDTAVETIMISRKTLATFTGMRDSTVKFYSEEGLLPYHQAGTGLARRYDREEAAKRIQEIRDLQTAGLSIPQIKARFRSI